MVLQKWSKGKVRDKLNNLILFDKATYEKLYKEVPSYKLITPSVVSERLKVRGSLARAGLEELLSKGTCNNILGVPTDRENQGKMEIKFQVWKNRIALSWACKTFSEVR